MAGSFAARRSRSARRRASQDSDRFLDTVVLLSVLVFVLLAAGVGVLVLQNSLH
jgi:hypothetical protein